MEPLDQPCQHYQRCRQTQNCHCEKYHRVGRSRQRFVHRCHRRKKAPAIDGRGKLSRADQRYNSALSALQTQGRTFHRTRLSAPKICSLKPRANRYARRKFCERKFRRKPFARISKGRDGVHVHQLLPDFPFASFFWALFNAACKHIKSNLACPGVNGARSIS